MLISCFFFVFGGGWFVLLECMLVGCIVFGMQVCMSLVNHTISNCIYILSLLVLVFLFHCSGCVLSTIYFNVNV